MKQIILASTNKGKIQEVRNIFHFAGYEIVSLSDMNYKTTIIEDGRTFEENAFIKAKTVFREYRIPVIADDSGISVEQLNGAPGIYSARYAGENATDHENNQKLLAELRLFSEPHRAKYICSAVYYDEKIKIAAADEIEGIIVNEPKGKNGFGYDPYFVPKGYQLRMAELKQEEKDFISHRGKAFRRLRDILIAEKIV